MTLVRRLIVFLAVSVGSIVLDQVTKVLATDLLKGQAPKSYLGDLFRWQYATNEGAFLSLGASLPPWGRFVVLTLGVGLLLCGIAVFAVWSNKHDGPQVTGYALIFSGGISNWVDRVRFDGVVVDFMNLGIGNGPWQRTGVFNVADLAILAGIGVLFVHGWIHDRRLKKEKEAAAAAGTSTEAKQE